MPWSGLRINHFSTLHTQLHAQPRQAGQARALPPWPAPPPPCQNLPPHSPQRRHAFSTWLRWPRGIAFLGPMCLKQLTAQFSEAYHPQGTAQTADWVTLLLLLWIRPIYLNWSFGKGAGFKLATHLEAMEVPLGNTAWGYHLWALVWPCYSSPGPPRKEIAHSSEAPNFSSLVKGTSLDHLVWRPAGCTATVL